MSRNHGLWTDVVPREFNEKRYVRCIRQVMRASFREEFGWRRFLMASYWRLLMKFL